MEGGGNLRFEDPFDCEECLSRREVCRYKLAAFLLYLCKQVFNVVFEI
jgi:hypothetical protein